VEIERTGVQKLMSDHADVRAIIERISLERLLLQSFGPGLEPGDVADVLASAKLVTVKPGEAIIEEGDEGIDLFLIRSGSMKVEKTIGGRAVFLNFVPANSPVGEMAMLTGGRRVATVRANLRSVVVRLDGATFRALLDRKPTVRAQLEAVIAERRAINEYTEREAQKFGSIVELYTARAQFLLDHSSSNQAIAEATDVLLIDETLCIGCDNCEKACADAHDGLSRLVREAGRTFDHLHVPTSCRHCEEPHCMTDCPPNAIHRGQAGEISINADCIGCGNCARLCPYGVIRMDKPPPPKPSLFEWVLFGAGPGPGEPDKAWSERPPRQGRSAPAAGAGAKKAVAIKCDMCATRPDRRPVCVKACPTGAAIRVSPQQFLTVARRRRL
jgi:Fe-S-cluster-containing hydrogenase component 2/CRP-like cAMP-binding protein